MCECIEPWRLGREIFFRFEESTNLIEKEWGRKREIFFYFLRNEKEEEERKKEKKHRRRKKEKRKEESREGKKKIKREYLEKWCVVRW